MATLSEADSRRMYSWWWDSHVSPKNSKWLQENLTDIDAKVKTMIKLIEEDADSFAKRAEMYYKKRPELMKLVEEFYRAYRALAERYDHATGALRQAHRTMAEAFPNQVPLVMADDSPASSASEADPRTFEMSTPVRALFDQVDLHKDVLGLSSSHFQAAKRNGALTHESDSVTSIKGLKQLNDFFGSGEHSKYAEGKARRGLNFHEAEENESRAQSNDRALCESQVGRAEKEILILKEALAKLEAEKEAGLVQYQQSLERFSKLESKVSRAQEESRELSDQASKAEAEAQSLREVLCRFEAEKEASHLQYQQCLDKISNLQNNLSDAQKETEELNERASKSETEAQYLKQEIARVEAEKDAALEQYKIYLEMISDLENKLVHAAEDARRFRESAEKAESEAETLKQAITILTEEKEAAAVQYQKCLESISGLERNLSFVQEEAQRLNDEIDNGVAKLKDAEGRCLLLEGSNQLLHSEMESLVLKTGTQSQELTEKQKELGRLWACIQEERLHYMEAETAFQTLQHLHSQAQEELISMALELQNKVQILRDVETCNQSLQHEILKLEEGNKSLNELNLSSAMSMKDLQNEIFSLSETNGMLEEEVELRVNQRNALQQEIYCLKEELNDSNKNHRAILEQVDALGFNPECFESSVKELQDENINLNENCQRERSEKVALLEKLVIMEQLVEKNALLENSLSDLGAELEGVRGKIKALEESCQSLLEEKSTLVDEKSSLLTQLQVTTENLEKLSEKNTVLENCLTDAHDELEVLKAKSKSLEDSCQLLVNLNAGLIGEKDALISQKKITHQRLEDLEKRFTELEEKYTALEKEKDATLCKVEKLKVSLEVQKQEHVSFSKISELRMAGMETQIHLLQEESRHRNKELVEELDRALDSQIQNFVLRKCVQDLEEKNSSLLIEFQKLLEASELSEKLISELETENLEQELEVKSMLDKTNTLRIGICQFLKALGIVLDHGCEDKNGRDQKYLSDMLSKVEDGKKMLCEAQDENQQLIVEMSVLITLLGQLRSEVTKLETGKHMIGQELSIKTEQFSAVQSEAQKLLETTEELRLKVKVKEGDQKEGLLTIQIENLHGKLMNMQGAYENLQEEKSQLLEETISLMKEFFHVKERNCNVEEENFALFGEVLSLSNLSLIFKNYIYEKSVEIKELGEDLDKLRGVNISLQEELSGLERKFEEVQIENQNVKDALQKSEHELITVTFVSDQLNYEVVNGKNLLKQKEMEILEAEWKLSTTENENSELHTVLDDLKSKYDEVNLTSDEQMKLIFKLSEDNDRLSKENECLLEASRRVEVELLQLHEEHEKTKNREENLCYKVKRGKDKTDMWETQVAVLYGELQTSVMGQALFEDKVHELTEACGGLQDEHTFKDLNIELLKERVNILERENGELKAQLDQYGPVIISLRDSISSVENHICLHKNLEKFNSVEDKDAELVNHPFAESHQSEDQNELAPDALSGLQDLQTRVKAIEKTLIEMESLTQENLNTHTKREDAARQMGEFSSQRENAETTSEISEVESGRLTKDIMLDQTSECSSRGISSRVTDSHMVELWETIDQDSSIDLTVGSAKKLAAAPTGKDIEYRQLVAVKHKSKFPSEELSVDKLELSKRSTEIRREGSKRKILERLNSDVQKLTNIQITVQDLKNKVRIIENSKKVKAIVECDALKGQLEEAEAAIQKLFDLNGKLVNNIELSDKKSSMESVESGSVRRRRISEQARRASEKIGLLQLEVQKIQFVLLKIDDEKESKGRGIVLDTKKRVLLRDYIYGGVRKSPRRKKAPFCGCIQPPTRGE